MRISFPTRLSMAGCVGLLMSSSAIAQVIPDDTLPEDTVVPSNCITCEITGGTRLGNNLFHSFEQFSIPKNGTAYFNNDGTIETIFSRVTGNSISRLNGIIRANGTADLFLLNPNGIIFGSNASLNVGGSFIATTAESIHFANGSQFTTIQPQTSPLLTVSVPIGLQFGQTAGAIANQSIAGSPEVGLQVVPGNTLALVGREITVPNGYLTAIGGRVELGSIAHGGWVGLTAIGQNWRLNYAAMQTFQDIHLTGGGIFVNGPAGGNVQIAGRQITLADGFQVLTDAELEGQAGDLRIIASESLELTGSSSDGFATALYNEVYGTATGRTAVLLIQTQRLILRDGAEISTGTYGLGRGVDLTVRAAESVELIGAGPSGLFSRVYENAVGNGGTLTINTNQLIVRGGAQVSTAARTGGRGGELIINAVDAVRLSGTAPIATPDNISGILVSAESGATNDAGSLEIITQLLEITDGARISADNFGSGDNGGNINLNVEQIELNHGEIKATTQSGTGGIIAIHNLEQMTLTNDSTLTAQAFNNARGGNIYINAPTGAIIAAVDTNSDIIASAEQGEGGDIVINAQTLLGLAERRAIPSNETNDIDASSEFGTSGTITINSPDTDLRAASPEFSTAPPNTELAQGCQLQGSRVISEFFNTGRGGLPLNPYESFSSTNILDDLRLPTQATAATHSAAEPVEAQGWIVNSKGQVVLVANVNPIAPHACHLR